MRIILHETVHNLYNNPAGRSQQQLARARRPARSHRHRQARQAGRQASTALPSWCPMPAGGAWGMGHGAGQWGMGHPSNYTHKNLYDTAPEHQHPKKLVVNC